MNFGADFYCAIEGQPISSMSLGTVLEVSIDRLVAPGRSIDFSLWTVVS